MSYGTKYTLTFPSYFDETCQLLIEEEGYAGASTDIYGADDPITIAWETPSDFLLEPINGSMATIRLVSETDFQFLDLYTSSNRKYRVTFNVGGALKWRGFLSPDQYREEYKAPPYINEFVAYDQLGYLKTVDWDQTGGAISLMRLLGYVFEKTGLELNLYEGINVFDSAHDMTSADSPLDQTYINGDAYEDKTYYDVLYDILIKFGAVIKQQNGCWFIFRPSEVYHSAFTSTPDFNLRYWTYSSGVFSYDSRDDYDPTLATTSATAAQLVRLTGSSMWVNPAWKKYLIIHDYLKRDGVLRNNDFTEWSGTTPSYWVHSSGVGAVTERHGNKVRLDPVALLEVPFRYWYQYRACTADVYRLSVKYNIYVTPYSQITVWFSVKKFSTDRYWDFDNNVWSVSPKTYSRTFDNSAGIVQMIEEVTVDITTSDSSTSTTGIFFYFNAPYVNTGGGYVEFSEVNLRVLGVNAADELFEYAETAEYDITVNNSNVHEGEELTIHGLDYPLTDANIQYALNGVLFSNSGLTTQTGNWTETAASPYNFLISLLGNNISNFHREPQQVLSGTIYSNLMKPTSVISETFNSGKYHLIKRAEWNPKYGTWNIEAHELYDYTADYVLQEIGDKILQETGDGILV